MIRTYRPDINSSLQERIHHSLHFGALHHLFMGAIILYAIFVALSGTSLHTTTYDSLLPKVEEFFLAIFIIELCLKAAVAPQLFFKHGWNIVEMGILIVSVFAPSAKVLRVLRFFIYLHIFSKHNFIKRVIHTFVHSLPTLMTSSVVLGGVIVCYGLLTTSLFGKNFPEFFGHIGASVYTLFQIMTLESWSMGVVRPVMDAYPWSWTVFVSYILFTTYGITNIFIGAIVNAMSFIDAQNQNDDDKSGEESQKKAASLDDLQKDIKALQSTLNKLSKNMK